MTITDFHTHAFPDALAERAMAALLAETDSVTAWRDGRIASLLASMDDCGIERAVLCSIATRPEQFGKILDWSRAVRSDRIVPFPSVHPADPRAPERVREIAEAGFKGVKLHPYYQDFRIDDRRMFPIYEAMSAYGLMAVFHTGFDIAFPRVRIADPARIVAATDTFPDLIFIATHLGAWEDWEEVERRLCGRPIYMEISFAIERLGRERARAMLLKHPREYVLFGTDSPWTDQTATLAHFRNLRLGDDWERSVLSENAERLLGPPTTNTVA